MRLRVDLELPYVAIPTSPSPVNPGHTAVWLPFLEVLLVNGARKHRVDALLDTGSALAVLGAHHAELLGIDWRRAPVIRLRGVSGVTSTHITTLRFVLPQADSCSWTAPVAFTRSMERMAVLGHLGFFDRFEARFRTRRRRFRILADV